MTALDADLESRLTAFKKHLRRVTAAFNDASREHGLGIRINSRSAEASLKLNGLDAVLEYSGDESGEGELHAEQIRTAVAATAEILGNPRTAGLIQGAMQSGKTTTSLALQFVAPTYYMVTGRPLYPVYLLTVHTSQAAQTKNEFERFLLFYRHLQFEVDPNPKKLVRPLADQASLMTEFRFTPSMHIYRERVLRSAFTDLFSASASPEEFVARRTRGKAIEKIADRIQAIARQQFKPLMIIDEPQFGVLDRLVPDPDTGELVAKPTVFKQILQGIADKLKIEPDQHSLVALSATPYEMYDVEQIWVVHQELGAGYRGFNFIAGSPIDPTKEIAPPKVLSLTEFANDVGVPELARINVSALDRADRFNKLKDKLGADALDYETYRAESVAALRQALLVLAKRAPSPDFGVCIRAKNENQFAYALARELTIDNDYEVLHYSGSEASGKSVKRIVAGRVRKDIPYLLLVTNRARMGDAFPRSARYFIELAEKFSDMNAMFQGFLGRACGYGKDTTVIVSDTNAGIIRDIVLVDGRYIFKPSQGAIIVGNGRRGRPTGLYVIFRDKGDTLLERYFTRIDKFVAKRMKSTRSEKIASHRSTTKDDTTQYAPLLQDAAELGIFEYVESAENRAKLAKGFPDFRILRRGETVESAGAINDDLTYALDRDNIGCKVTLRENVGSVSTGGIRARGAQGGGGGRDAQQWHLEPQILLRKHDPESGAMITDRGAKRRRVGDWRVFAVVLPLKKAVRPLISGEGTLPLARTAIDPWVQGDQRVARDEAVAAKSNRGQGPI